MQSLPSIIIPTYLDKVFLEFPKKPNEPDIPRKPEPVKETYEPSGFGSTSYAVILIGLGLIPILRDESKYLLIQIVVFGIAAVIIYFKIKLRNEFKNELPFKRVKYEKDLILYKQQFILYKNNLEAYNKEIEKLKEINTIRFFRSKKIKEQLRFRENILKTEDSLIKKAYPLFAQKLEENDFLIKPHYSSNGYFLVAKNIPFIVLLISIVKPSFGNKGTTLKYNVWQNTNPQLVNLFFSEEHILFNSNEVVMSIKNILMQLNLGMKPAFGIIRFPQTKEISKISLDYKNYLNEIKNEDYLIATGVRQKNPFFYDYPPDAVDDLPF